MAGADREMTSALPKELQLDFLKKITNDFSDERKIGQGAFGTVYKGILEDGTYIAVKRLMDEDTYDQKFQNEIGHLMTFHHENIVRIVAFCQESQKKLVQYKGRYIIAEIVERLLCYEYIPKGSLDKYMLDEPDILDWEKRFKIIKGICRGLHFLHEEMDRPTVHLNLQPANILLDDKLVPKITDFGTSRVFGADQTRMITKNHEGGVLGYMAPEYLYHGEISKKSDIYSLGLIIIEITTREKNCSNTRDKSARNFIQKVEKEWTLDQIMCAYPDLEEDDLNIVETCLQTGLKCVEINSEHRPSISEIVKRIEC